MIKNKLILPCLRGVLGDWVYYSSILSAKQIKEKILTAKAIREAQTLDDELQRDLHKRSGEIAKYLLNDKSRFFNSIIIGVFNGVPDWVEFDLSKGKDFIEDDEAFKDIKSSVGLMIFNGHEQMFAIDGQHRIAGIQEAFDKDTKKILKDDQFPVIFIAHIDDDKGKKRTRKLFSDINKNAKPVSKGDTITIDEENLSAIVTRRIYANYKHFNKGRLIAVTEKANMDYKDNEHFNNLIGLYEVNQNLKKIFRKNNNLKEWDEQNIDKFYKIVESFYDFIFEHISDYNKFFIKKSLSLKKERENNANLLFRPIGLTLISKLYVYYYQKKRLDTFKRNINKISFKFPNSPFNNVVWNNGRIEGRSMNQILAYDLSLYILRETPKNKSQELKKRYLQIIKKGIGKLPERIKSK